MNPVGVAVVTGSLIYLAFLLTYFVTVPSSTVDAIDILIPSVFFGLGCGHHGISLAGPAGQAVDQIQKGKTSLIRKTNRTESIHHPSNRSANKAGQIQRVSELDARSACGSCTFQHLPEPISGFKTASDHETGA